MKVLRVEKGLEQSELAALTGLTQAQISDYEQGKRLPNVVNIIKIADALDHSALTIMEALGVPLAKKDAEG